MIAGTRGHEGEGEIRRNMRFAYWPAADVDGGRTVVMTRVPGVWPAGKTTPFPGEQGGRCKHGDRYDGVFSCIPSHTIRTYFLVPSIASYAVSAWLASQQPGEPGRRGRETFRV